MKSYIRALVLDKDKKELMPCHAARARKLLKAGRAAVFRLNPFTIIMKDRTRETSAVQKVLVKIDPGSKQTGIALVRVDVNNVHHPLGFFCVVHRGLAIRDGMTARRQYRRGRRSRNLRYRAKRFDNRRRPEGWLPPSLQHRVDTVLSWVKRFIRYVPVSGIVMELVRFDTQLMENPDIAGVAYQQGELAGYELREYLLEKFGRQCVYCGKKDVPLNIEHVVPKARGGSNRVSNLAIACVQCNQKKGARPVEEFLKDKPEVLARVRRQLKAPLRDAAPVNATRWALFRKLKETGLPVETGSGGLTKFNRHTFAVPKEHWLDALCVGRINSIGDRSNLRTLQIYCIGRGRYQRTRTNKYGFPICYFSRQKVHHGFKTGDYVRLTVKQGKKPGVWRGRATAKSKSIVVEHNGCSVEGSYKNAKQLFKSDGYKYQFI